MRRNGYLWPFDVKLDTAVRFADPVFLLECKISATWQRFPLIFLHFTCWFSAIFLLPVCLTYWPKKYTTRVDPYVDNSHQVWSWYDHHCRVIAFLSADTSRDLDLWPFDLEQLSYIAGRVTNLATKFEHPMTIRSWVTSYRFPLITIENAYAATAHAPNHESLTDTIKLADREKPLLRACIWAVSPTQAKL